MPKNRQGRPLALGLAIGIAIGAGMGVAMKNIGAGVGAGLALGTAVGVAMEKKAKWQSGVANPDREHHSDEFGRVGSAAIRGAEMPAMAAPAMITIDGIVERESGVTPPPPAITVKAIVITLVIMLLVGFAILAYLSTQPKPDFDSWGDVSMSCGMSASS